MFNKIAFISVFHTLAGLSEIYIYININDEIKKLICG